MTREEMESRFLALRESICEALAGAGYDGFTLSPIWDERDRNRLLRLTRGARGLGLMLSCNHYSDPGKVRIAVDTPTDAKRRAMFWGDVMPYNSAKMSRESTPEIKVSLGKPPETIARDIARRLLPTLDSAWPIFEKRMAEVRESMDNRAATLDAIRAMGGRFNVREGDITSTVHVTFAAGARNLSVEVNEYGHLRIPHFAPDLPMLRAIVAALKESAA